MKFQEKELRSNWLTLIFLKYQLSRPPKKWFEIKYPGLADIESKIYLQIFYSMTLEWQYIKSDQNDRQQLLCFAVQAVNAFKIYNRKNIAAEKIEKSMLDSLYATFQLMVTQIMLRLKKISIQEVDFQLIKKQLMLIFKSEFAENCFVYMRYMTEDFMINLLELHYLKTARVFMNLCTHILGCIQKTNEKVTKQQYLSNTDKDVLYAENNFFEAYLFASSRMMHKDSFWTFEKGAKEGILEDLLMKLGIEDKYEYIPEMIQTFKQVIKICNSF